MLDDLVAYLTCPHCGDVLARDGGALHCSAGHSFDIARHGYVNLLSGGASASTADTVAMVRARAAFLATGAFDPLADGIVNAVKAAAPQSGGCIVDVGAGTGHYLARVLEATPHSTGLALDLSKHAAGLAARAHPRVGAAVCDTWGALPVRTGATAVVIDVFAPRNVAEFRRVLAPDGALVVVTPTPRHLQELVGPLGLLVVDPAKDERLEVAMDGLFVTQDLVLVEEAMQLTRGQLHDLVAMGPSSRHADGDRADRIEALAETTTVTLSARVATYRPV